MRYAVKFFNGDEFVAVGHGEAEDEYWAETKAEFWMMFNRPNTSYDRIEVTEESEV